MKKVICTILLLFMAIHQPALAITKTPTPTSKPTAEKTPEASEEAELDTIQKIKEMVANKVSKLNLVEKRGILGTVKETSTTQITIETIEKTQRFIDIDELTKFQESLGSSKSFGISDIKKGDTLGFIGLYNKDTRRLLARFVTKANSIPVNIQGIVSEKDATEFTLTVVTEDGKKRLVDVQTSTKSYLYTDEEGEAKSGFTKIQIGQRVIVAGFEDADDKETLNASRITHFEELPPSENMRKHARVPEKEDPEKKITTPTEKPRN